MTTKHKILYVDDEPINLMLFEINLRNKYNVLTASNGLEGLKVLHENLDTNIIISDMKMPVMNGIEFIKKGKKEYPGKKFFILTGFEITDEIQNALDTGLIIEYFRKPFAMEKIDRIIKKELNL